MTYWVAVLSNISSAIMLVMGLIISVKAYIPNQSDKSFEDPDFKSLKIHL